MSVVTTFAVVLKTASNAQASLNILGNAILPDQAQELVEALKCNKKCTALCGVAGDELTNIGFAQPTCCNEISHNKSLTKVDISFNTLSRGKRVVDENGDLMFGDQVQDNIGIENLFTNQILVLTTMNLPGNEFGDVSSLIRAMGSNKGLSTLCGFVGDEKDLDLTKNGLPGIIGRHGLPSSWAWASMTDAAATLVSRDYGQVSPIHQAYLAWRSLLLLLVKT
jgi:hypothetical protein